MGEDGVNWQGVLMAVVGVWVILRTVTKDSSGRTLIDHILGRKATTSTSSSGSGSSSKATSSGGFLSGVLGTGETIAVGGLTGVASAAGGPITETYNIGKTLINGLP